MKKVWLSGLIALTLMSANAKTLSILDRGNEFTPSPFNQVLNKYEKVTLSESEGTDEYQPLSAPFQVSQDKNKVQFVVVVPGTGGSAAGQFWLVEKSKQGSKVIWSDEAALLTQKSTIHHGYHDILVTIGNAGHCSENLYQFNGKTYVPSKKAKDCLQ